MTNPFPEIHGKLGFGGMRMTKEGDAIDHRLLAQMIDTYMESGFNYFDTAHGYHDGLSEPAYKKCLTSRYPRESYVLTDKLTAEYFKSEEDVRKVFGEELECCGVEYFDFFLMHALGNVNYDKFVRCRAFETAFELKKEGKIRHVGISFHDTADMLEKILNDYPQIEIVQIQLNYLDYEDGEVQSRKVYEVCRRHNKPMLIMEPVKGGNLVKLPDKALRVLEDLGGGSPASYALRFAAGFDGIVSVLSGMSNMEQLEDNIRTMKGVRKLDERERAAVQQVVSIIHDMRLIDCTACRYCTAGCPKKILIPDLFSCMNTKELTGSWNPDFYYRTVYTQHGGKASDCVGCGKCEKACPQHLPIRKLLKQVADQFEKEENDA